MSADIHVAIDGAIETDRQTRTRRLASRRRLRYVSDRMPGFHRRKRGRGFSYVNQSGVRIRTRDVLQRIQSLAIPPAWSDVWICAQENGHLQATGMDQQGRKQYLYHPRWREAAEEIKFERMTEVGAALPKLRRHVVADLRARKLSRNKVIAAMVRLLDATGIRIGSKEYRRDNGSYGLTTLSRRHVQVNGDALRFDFRGKSGIRQTLEVRDAQVARVVRQCLKLRGKEVFQYSSDDGVLAISAQDVNQYLNEASGGVLTAKDFRTWQASVCVAAEFAAHPSAESPREISRHCKEALSKAAALLGNTVTVCRKYYVHSRIVDVYSGGEYPRLLAKSPARRSRWLARDERLLLHLLQSASADA